MHFLPPNQQRQSTEGKTLGEKRCRLFLHAECLSRKPSNSDKALKATQSIDLTRKN